MFPDSIPVDEVERRYGAFGPVEHAMHKGVHVTLRGLSDGYMMNVGGSRTLHLGNQPNDEIFSQAGLGSVNITKARKILEQEGRANAQKVNIDEGLITHIQQIEVDPEFINSMTIQRRNEPIIFLKMGDDHFMIDGHHRLQRRIKDGCTFVRVFGFREEAKELLECKAYRLRDDVWQAFDPLKYVLNDPSKLEQIK